MVINHLHESSHSCIKSWLRKQHGIMGDVANTKFFENIKKKSLGFAHRTKKSQPHRLANSLEVVRLLIDSAYACMCVSAHSQMSVPQHMYGDQRTTSGISPCLAHCW